MDRADLATTPPNFKQMVWWATLLFLYLLSIPLSLHLGYIAAFGWPFYILVICGVLFIMELPHFGWGSVSGLSRFPIKRIFYGCDLDNNHQQITGLAL